MLAAELAGHRGCVNRLCWNSDGSLLASVSDDTDLIIRKCRELDPERRYPTAAALAEELWRVHRGEPVETRPLGWLARPWHRWRGAWRRG